MQLIEPSLRVFIFLALAITFLDSLNCDSSKRNTTSIKRHRNHTAKSNRGGSEKPSIQRRRQEKSVTSVIVLSTTQASNEPDFDDLIIASYYNQNLNENLHEASQQQQQQDVANNDRQSESAENFQALKRNSNALTINVTAILGQSAFLPCAVRNLGTHNILWLRVKDGDVLAFDDMVITQDQRFKLIKKSANESNLLVQNVRLNDAGEYVCQINTESVKSKFVNLIILTPPTFSDIESNHDLSKTHPALASTLTSDKQSAHYHHNKPHGGGEHDKLTKSVNVIEGRQLILECNAFGFPKPTINWYVKRYRSDDLTVFTLNSSKIFVANVLQKQYDFFECEASNKVPPSISRKFKINVLYRPEISVTPTKVYITSMPVKVRVNCSVHSFPEASINWIHNYINLKETNQQTLKKLRQALDFNNVKQTAGALRARKIKFSRLANKKLSFSEYSNRFLHSPGGQTTPRVNRNSINYDTNLNNVDEEFFNRDSSGGFNNQLFFTSSSVKYNIIEHSVNETFKLNTIVINVENENDFGTYECLANNSAGSKSVKFTIYGEPKTSQTSQNLTVKASQTKSSNKTSKNSNSNEELYKPNYHQAKTLKNDDHITLEENLSGSSENKTSVITVADEKNNPKAFRESIFGSSVAPSKSGPSSKVHNKSIIFEILKYLLTLSISLIVFYAL